MIVIDANLLLYAHDSSDLRHPVVGPWFEGLMSSADEIGLSLLAILAFIR